MDMVLLGFVDQPISDPSVVSWETNKIGGSPCWMTAPSSGPTHCNVCNSSKTFICQFYCPLSGSDFHRTLYIFVCSHCHQLNQKGSWTVLRSQCITSESSLKHTENTLSGNTDNCRGLSADDWCSDADDWGEDFHDNDSHFHDSNTWHLNETPTDDRQESADSLPRFSHVLSPAMNCENNDPLSSPLQDAKSAGLQKLSHEPAELLMHLKIDVESETPVITQNKSSTDVHQRAVSDINGKPISDDATELEPYYIYVIEEPASSDSLDHVEDLLNRYRLQEGNNFNTDLESGTSTSGGGEKYEKVKVHHGDYVFYKFTQNISNNADQIVRYCRNGQPLFAGADTRDVAVPQCKCGSKRTFELQLMPALVNTLRRPHQSEPLVEFMTVHVYTCSQNCWTRGAEFVEEFAVVEYDRDSMLINEALSRITAGPSNTAL